MVAGLTQFAQRLESGFSPWGEALAQEFAREGSVTAMLAFAFCFGFGATVAEPALLEEYRANTPVITFRDSMTLHVGDYTFELMLMPGHTFYQASVSIKEQEVVFTTDNIFHKVQT